MNNEKEIKPSERIKELSNKWKSVNFGFDLSYVMAIVDFMDEQHVKKSEECSLSPSEALFGFCGWLTSRDKPITASSRHDAGEWACLVDEFCKANKLTPPRHNWTNYLTHPKPSPSSEPSDKNYKVTKIVVNDGKGNKEEFYPKEHLVDGNVEELQIALHNTGRYSLTDAKSVAIDIINLKYSKQPAQRTLSVEELSSIVKTFCKDYRYEIAQAIHNALVKEE